ncbi:MAG: tetratricopeptide repeat protein [Deltaproteobacteria bacterium]|nr:tetratricopeptide repeat protein [Deltaproteobacteria bacterium]
MKSELRGPGRYRLATLVVAITIGSSPLHAETPAEQTLARIRDLYAKGDYGGVRRELLAAYDRAPDPALLFALGQVELNLGNYAAAIDYYERFITTGPSDEQVALAQQAIGAARMRLANPDEPADAVTPVPTPEPVEPIRTRRRWTTEDTGLLALGAAAVVVGAGLYTYGYRMGSDASGTLAEYDERLDQARATQWTGVGIASAGALLAGVTVLRWRLRSDGAVISAAATPSGASLVVSRRW